MFMALVVLVAGVALFDVFLGFVSVFVGSEGLA